MKKFALTILAAVTLLFATAPNSQAGPGFRVGVSIGGPVYAPYPGYYAPYYYGPAPYYGYYGPTVYWHGGYYHHGYYHRRWR